MLSEPLVTTVGVSPRLPVEKGPQNVEGSQEYEYTEYLAAESHKGWSSS
jgi:hypothetical protein